MAVPRTHPALIPFGCHLSGDPHIPGPVVLDRVRRIRARLMEGSYPVVAELVAEAIVFASRSSRAVPEPPRTCLIAELQQIVVTALRTWPTEDILQLQLEFVEQLSLPAIAMLMGTSADEAQIRRSRIFSGLAAALAG